MVVSIKEERNAYKTKQVDRDGLWKKVIGELFEDFLCFFTPELHEQVDFSKGPNFLDKELFQEVVDEKKGSELLFFEKLNNVETLIRNYEKNL